MPGGAVPAPRGARSAVRLAPPGSRANFARPAPRAAPDDREPALPPT